MKQCSRGNEQERKRRYFRILEAKRLKIQADDVHAEEGEDVRWRLQSTSTGVAVRNREREREREIDRITD